MTLAGRDEPRQLAKPGQPQALPNLFSRTFSNEEIKEFVATRQETAPQPGGTRLSVVVPSYNQVQFLRRTLNSIANQHYGNLQLIVMDGGSTDGSQAVIEEFQDIISHFESGPDDGQAMAINKGFGHADGDFVAWQNSDDLYLPGFFHAIDAAVTLHPNAELIIANNYHIDAADRIIWASRYGPFSVPYLAYVEWNLSSQSAFVRRSLAERVGPLPDYNVAFDYEWFLRVGKLARGIVELRRYGGCYRLHAESKLTTADVSAREALELRILAELGYRPVPGRSLAQQWRVRRVLWRLWQWFNRRLLYTQRVPFLPARVALACILKLFRPGMLGYVTLR